MVIEIKVPSLGESVTDATVAKWLKQAGESVALDEPVVELETDKVNIEVPAPAAGTLAEIVAEEGATLPVGAVLGMIGDASAGVRAPHPTPLEATLPLPGEQQPAIAAAEPAGEGHVAILDRSILDRSGPAVRKLVAETGVDARDIIPTGPGHRLTKADVMAAMARPKEMPASMAPSSPTVRPLPVAPPPAVEPPSAPVPAGEREVRVRMTRLRQRIAERLKAAQNAAAMLTTFNEIDMSRTMALREQWRDAFEKKHGVRLGFMSVFVKASIAALMDFPGVN